jgi:hypothetical protein
MLQYVILHYADFAPANLGQLNTAFHGTALDLVTSAAAGRSRSRRPAVHLGSLPATDPDRRDACIRSELAATQKQLPSDDVRSRQGSTS